MRIALVGTGRMGQAVRRVAEERGHRVVAGIGSGMNRGGTGITRERLADAEVVVEFTNPDAVVGNLLRLVELGVPVVTGTTGWSEELPRVVAAVEARGSALLHAPNFSIGAQLLGRAAREVAAAIRGREGFDAGITEAHHREKRDAPSGTALALQRQLQVVDPTRGWPIISVRTGWVPGTHTLEIEGRFETLTITHTVRDRAVFAEGAVVAAEWLKGRRGVFTLDHLLGGTS